MKFSDCITHVNKANYRVNVSWFKLKSTLDEFINEYNLNMNPDFQRDHVWTNEQKIAFVEFKLRGGEGSDIVYFNCKGWMQHFDGPFVLVDGKQRLAAVVDFLDNKFPVFETYYRRDFDNDFDYTLNFLFAVNNLQTRKEVLRWYLEINSGGTPHSKEEIEKVRCLLDNEP